MAVDKVTVLKPSSKSSPDPVVLAEWKRRKERFQSEWNTFVLFQWFPFFAMFVVVGSVIRKTPYPWLLMLPTLGFGAFLVSKGVRLVRRFHTCPVCEGWQQTGYFHPFRQCRHCGVQLTEGPSR